MQVAFYFAGEITQVLDAIPWVRCASGNVWMFGHNMICPSNIDSSIVTDEGCLFHDFLPCRSGPNLDTTPDYLISARISSSVPMEDRSGRPPAGNGDQFEIGRFSTYYFSTYYWSHSLSFATISTDIVTWL